MINCMFIFWFLLHIVMPKLFDWDSNNSKVNNNVRVYCCKFDCLWQDGRVFGKQNSFHFCSQAGVDHIAPETLILSTKLRNLEEMPLDIIEYYRKQQFCMMWRHNYCLLDVLCLFHVAEVTTNEWRVAVQTARCFLHMSLCL